jgi:hypothetical protein
MAFLTELFTHRVELPDGGHVDCRADEDDVDDEAPPDDA